MEPKFPNSSQLLQYTVLPVQYYNMLTLCVAGNKLESIGPHALYKDGKTPVSFNLQRTDLMSFHEDAFIGPDDGQFQPMTMLSLQNNPMEELSEAALRPFMQAGAREKTIVNK